MDRLLELINRKFLKDSEFLELEDNDNVISCEYYRPHNAHYKEFLVTINIYFLKISFTFSLLL